MAASDHLHPGQIPGQMKLFMSGTEFRGASHASIDFGPKGEEGSLERHHWDKGWNTKLEESKQPEGTKMDSGWRAHGSGVYDSLLEHGYQPERHDEFDEGLPGPTLYIDHGLDDYIQGEGHHRVAAAADIEEKTGRHTWMPVNYEDDPYYRTAHPSEDARR